jgi:hypothetical protein
LRCDNLRLEDAMLWTIYCIDKADTAPNAREYRGKNILT